MHNILKGILVGVLGLAIWMAFSVYEGISQAAGETTAFGMSGVYIGFFIMVGGPVVYIVVLPVAGWLRSRRARGEVRTSP